MWAPVPRLKNVLTSIAVVDPALKQIVAGAGDFTLGEASLKIGNVNGPAVQSFWSIIYTSQDKLDCVTPVLIVVLFISNKFAAGIPLPLIT